jgi:hypothetical protein
MTVADASVWPDDEGRGKGARTPIARCLLVAIEQHREADARLLHEAARGARVLASVHGQHDERLCAQRPPQRLDRRRLLAARAAPARPEIYQHDLAAVVRQAMDPAVQIGQDKWRGRGAAPGAEVLRRRGKRYGPQQEGKRARSHGDQR